METLGSLCATSALTRKCSVSYKPPSRFQPKLDCMLIQTDTRLSLI
jgi:hypothetical protein